MVHCTNTAACAAEGGLVTFAQVRGARVLYSGSIVRGPEMPAPLWPSPLALLHPVVVKNIKANKQNATQRMRLVRTIIESPWESFAVNLRKGNAVPPKRRNRRLRLSQ
jgi:hypothetical protein